MTISNITKELSKTSSSKPFKIDSSTSHNSAYNLENYSCKLDSFSYTANLLASSFSQHDFASQNLDLSSSD